MGDYYCSIVDYSSSKCFRSNEDYDNGSSNTNLQFAGWVYCWICSPCDL